MMNAQNCKKPNNESMWVKSTLDKNYEYFKPTDEDQELCWWVRNISNGKIFNLTKLSQTNPKILKSIDISNKELLNKYS